MTLRRMLGWGMPLLGVILAAASLPLAIADHHSVPGFGSDPVTSLLGLVWLVTGSAIVSRKPRNWAGWSFVAIGASAIVTLFLQAYAVYGLRVQPGLPAVAWAAVAQEFALYLLVLVPLLILLFPDGHVPTRRWRWAVVGLLGGTGTAMIGYLIKPGPLNNIHGFGIVYENPFGIHGFELEASIVIVIGTILALVSSLSTVIGLRFRFKRATGEERQQLRWLVFVATTAGALFVLTVLAGALGEVVAPGRHGGFPIFPTLFVLCALTLFLGIPAAYLVAIVKHRLYDLDVVIRRTVVLGLLAVFITAVYAAVVALASQLFTSTTSSFLAAAVLAVAFQPARERVTRLADRVVYGKRATPYEVLAEFSGRVSESYSVEEVLPRMAQVVTAATGAEGATIWLAVGAALRPATTWPVDGSAPEALPGDAAEVRDRGELLGAISVRLPATDPMDPQKQRLIADLAAQAGLVLRNVRLLEELKESRRRLVDAQDEERRRLQRALADGTERQLADIRTQLASAGSMLRERTDEGVSALGTLQSRAAAVLDDLRELARGIYPPLLADRGLREALSAQAHKLTAPTTVDVHGIGRYPPEVEATVYFCALEALQNVAKYANASAVALHLEGRDGELAFVIEDDGRGFDISSTGYGSGLQGMADRLDAIGGRLVVRSEPGRGTVISGMVPVLQPEGA